jgi:acyl-CoA thioesterase-2
MSRVLDELLELLELERIDENLFRGHSQDLGFGAVFGGQVIGQALSAARHTVTGQRPVHSFHCYFLRPGDADRPIVYDVEAIRDGRSVSTRRAKAVQRGQPIFFMTASFHESAPGLDHQDPMPVVTPPEDLERDTDRARRYQDLVPEPMRDFFMTETPIEIRTVDHVDPRRVRRQPARRQLWFRANGALPDDERVHRYVLAYASDFGFLVTALQPHGVGFWERGVRIASIDHAMWFHRPLRFDDWLLYDVDSPSAAGTRALVRGRIFSRDGRLVASTAQEGMIRVRGDDRAT